MNTMGAVVKVMLAEIAFLLALPALGWVLAWRFGLAGVFGFLVLFAIWCWEFLAYCQYRACRQAEVLHVLQAAAATAAPVEAVLNAFQEDRPDGGLHSFWVGLLLFFLLPGYYWVHKRRRFDARLARVVGILMAGVPLGRALGMVPGVASRQTALAVGVGEFAGKLAPALHRLSGRRSAPLWLELLPRVLYPLVLLFLMVMGLVFFISPFILPRLEKMFTEFKIELPEPSRHLIGAGRWVTGNLGLALPLWGLLLLLVNAVVFSSRLKWHLPLIGRLYRMHARGEFLHVLGVLLETGKPLPQVLDYLTEEMLSLPRAVRRRAERLEDDVLRGQPFVESLLKHGLITAPMKGLLLTAEKAGTLPWALQELGETLDRRSRRIAYRLGMVVFPLAIFACACLVAFVTVSLFLPWVALIEGTHG